MIVLNALETFPFEKNNETNRNYGKFQWLTTKRQQRICCSCFSAFGMQNVSNIKYFDEKKLYVHCDNRHCYELI